MSKYIILLVVAIAAFISIRMQVDTISKAMYMEGCTDVVLKLHMTGREESASAMASFCSARKYALDNYFGVFK
jgi:hypothetical protein